MRLVVADALGRAGREAGAALGQLNIAREIRRVNPQKLRVWASMLSFAARELSHLADRMENRQ